MTTSGKNKLKVGLDLDGVVYNWGDTVRYLIKHHHGLDLPPSTYWNYVPDHVDPEIWAWLWDWGVEEGGLFQYGNIIKGAIEGIKEIAEFCDLEIITHRPPHAIPDTCAFIARLPNVWQGIHLLTRQENKSLIDVDIYIDDGPHVAEDVLHADKRILIFDQPWNQDVSMNRPGVIGRANWDEIPRILEKELDA